MHFLLLILDLVIISIVKYNSLYCSKSIVPCSFYLWIYLTYYLTKYDKQFNHLLIKWRKSHACVPDSLTVISTRKDQQMPLIS